MVSGISCQMNQGCVNQGRPWAWASRAAAQGPTILGAHLHFKVCIIYMCFVSPKKINSPAKRAQLASFPNPLAFRVRLPFP